MERGGEILASQTAIHSEIANPSTTEAYAGLQAVKLGISMGLNKMGVVGDSKTIIKKCQSTAENVYAHVIAKEALKRRESFYLMGESPNRFVTHWKSSGQSFRIEGREK
ncbi:hypothetical protein Gohar_000027 [Gossypium harknessii]|uniref:RNase H type-1 domain-containing protein n=1 Tax=Gossypium harknessii TaxID=34285 RepID=A0A7J9IB05_9ROSI|nr:hypothetical protein [Gossypium harknessii]